MIKIIHLHNIMWHITEPSSLKLCCSLYFLLIQSWQLRAFSSHPGHAHRPKIAHWFPGIYHSFMDSLFPKFPFYSFRSTNCLPQLLPTAWGWCNVQHLPVIVFNKCPQGKSCSHWDSSKSGQIKTALWVVSFREP